MHCLEVDDCEYLCSQLDGCHSIDARRDGIARCFLNTYECDSHVENNHLVPSEEYELRIKQLHENERRLGRSLRSEHVRHLLAGADPGISWDSILRFKDAHFTSGGEYKLCFCDSDLLTGDNEICDGPEDYTIEIGSIHSTGLQCLLNNPKMARGTCEKQEYGGLRCYDDDVPTVHIPADYMNVLNPLSAVDMTATEADLQAQLLDFCRFGSPSETAQFAFCNLYRDAIPMNPPADSNA